MRQKKNVTVPLTPSLDQSGASIQRPAEPGPIRYLHSNACRDWTNQVPPFKCLKRLDQSRASIHRSLDQSGTSTLGPFQLSHIWENVLELESPHFVNFSFFGRVNSLVRKDILDLKSLLTRKILSHVSVPV